MKKVAIQGTRGSYSEEAALLLLGEAEFLECRDFAGTFGTLAAGRAEYAVVPVENKIIGNIEGTASILREGRFRILETANLKIDHILVGTPDARLDDIETVRSHVAALKQCRLFLEARPNWTQVIGADTASSVCRIVKERDPAKAAIGSRRAAEIYGAKVLAENIADDRDNWTNFCLVSF